MNNTVHIVVNASTYTCNTAINGGAYHIQTGGKSKHNMVHRTEYNVKFVNNTAKDGGGTHHLIVKVL